MTAERSLDSQACIGCGAAVISARCDHCGAAQRAGGYRTVRVLAERPGGSGRIYLAIDPQGQQVALKELLFALVPGAQQLEAFLREGKVLEQLAHPQVPRFVESFQEGTGVGTRLYLAQEFVDAPSLLTRLQGHYFSVPETIAIARQVLEILAYLHGRHPKVLHRDLKPANLLQRDDGSIVLVDFGAARLLGKDATHNATAVGTFGYMPLEQLGGTVDDTSDLYALGATLLHLLEGRAPEELLHDGPYLQVDPHLPVPPDFARFLSRLIAARREDRFASAREALRALDLAEEEARALATPATVAAREAPARSRVSTVPKEIVVLPKVEAPLAPMMPSEATPQDTRWLIAIALFGAALLLALSVFFVLHPPPMGP